MYVSKYIQVGLHYVYVYNCTYSRFSVMLSWSSWRLTGGEDHNDDEDNDDDDDDEEDYDDDHDDDDDDDNGDGGACDADGNT